MKRLLSAALLVLTPVTASAEYGNELTRWNTASPREEAAAPAPAPEKPADAPLAAPTGPAVVEKADEKKDDKKVSAGSAVLTPEQLAKLQGFFFSASIDQYVGLGTFIDPNLYSSVGTWVNAFVSYRKVIGGRNFSLGVQPFGAQGVTYEYTMPDNLTGRRVINDDARLALSMPALLKEKVTGIVFSPNITVIVPTTPESWHAGLITRVGLGGAANRVFGLPQGSLMVSISGFATYGIYTSTANVTKAPNGPTRASDTATTLCRNGENICNIAGNNPAVAVRGGIGATWLATDFFFVSMSYGVIAGWNYAVTNDPNDPNNPHGRDVNGNPVARAGMVGNESQFGSVSVAINITDVLSASLYLYNLAPILQSNRKDWAFPFLDVTTRETADGRGLTGLQKNYTILGLSLAATF